MSKVGAPFIFILFISIIHLRGKKLKAYGKVITIVALAKSNLSQVQPRLAVPG